MEKSDSKALELVQTITNKAIEGFGPLCKATTLAEQYKNDKSYSSIEERVQALVRWETTKNFSSGFVSGLGGILTLPVAIPGALGASWIIQARLVAAIATLYGHDIKNDRVRLLIVLSILGDSVKDVLKEAGVAVATRISMAAIQQVPGRLLIEINKQVGFRLITKAGTTGVINLTKLVPFVGGVVAGSADAYFCQKVGQFAAESFKPHSDSESKVA